MLKTRNIYIDTQAFIASNYFQSENLRRLAEFGKQGVIKIFMTDITRQEIINNAANDLMNAIQDINDFKKRFENKAKILKNIEQFRPYLELPKIKLETQLDKITTDLDQFLIEANIEFIPYHTADLTDIVTKYFDQSKPFGQGKKKHEFPDAIVISAIEHWCNTLNEKMYMISADKDMNGGNSKQLLTIGSLKDILGLINHQNDSDERMCWIKSVFDKSSEQIKQSISAAFEDALKNEIGYEVEIDDVEIEDITLYDYFVVSDEVKGGETILQFDYDISFSARVIYDDYSFAFYNKIGKRPFGSMRNSKRISSSSTQTAEISLETSSGFGGYKDTENVLISCLFTSVPDAENLFNRVDGFHYCP